MDTFQRTMVSIERIDKPATLAGKYRLSFHLTEQQAVSVHLTQGELLDLWGEIGAFFNLLGMGDAKRHGETWPAGLHEHDGYAPHSHEVRADHLGVARND
jgi:hypothetical protein